MSRKRINTMLLVIAMTAALGSCAKFNDSLKGVFSAFLLAPPALVPGISLEKPVSFITHESGISQQFRLKLNNKPSSPVTISFYSSNTNEGATDVTELTFTGSDWNAWKTVTVTGVDDYDPDGDKEYHIIFNTVSSDDPEYTGRTIDPLAFINTDDEVPGFTVFPAAGLTVSETGTSEVFSIVLATTIQSPVTVYLTSSDPGECVTDLPSVTFTPADWNVPQNVTVTGIDDEAADGDKICTISFAVMGSSEPVYQDGFPIDDLHITVTDDDTPGFIISPDTPLFLCEATGCPATVNFSLKSRPSAPVSVHITTDRTDEITIAGSTSTTLGFSSASCGGGGTWCSPQSVVFSGKDDAFTDGAQNFTVTVNLSSADPDYNGLSFTLNGTNADNETASVTVNPVSGLTVSETGSTASFTVKLNAKPTDTVTIAVASSDTSEITVSPSVLTFTTSGAGGCPSGGGNWCVNQTVVLTGVPDYTVDANKNVTISLTPSSSDAQYNSLVIPGVSAVNNNIDAAGFQVIPASSVIFTTESGGTANIQIRLTSRPVLPVTVNGIAAIKADFTASPEVNLSAASLTFTGSGAGGCGGGGNWCVYQTVTVTGTNQGDSTEFHDYFYINYSSVSSGDTLYNGLSTGLDQNGAAPGIITGINADTDGPDLVRFFTSPLGSTPTVTEGNAGPALVYTYLKQPPSSNVNVSFTSTDTSEVSHGNGGSAVVFTPGNWYEVQSVSFSSVDDCGDDGNKTIGINISAASTDPLYGGYSAPSAFSVINNDNDTKGFLYQNRTGGITTESGGTRTGRLRLASCPLSGPVTVNLTSSDTTEGDVTSPVSKSLTFTVSGGGGCMGGGNWCNYQDIIITGADDTDLDGNIAYQINSSTITGSGTDYDGMTPLPFTVTNQDNERLIFATAPVDGWLDADNNGNPVAEADALCNAQKSSLDPAIPAGVRTAAYKAMIADGVNRSFVPSVNPVFISGFHYGKWSPGYTFIATANASLYFTFDLSASFPGYSGHWTGLNADWTTSAYLCSDSGGRWNSNSSAVSGRIGNSGALSSDSIRDSVTPDAGCNTLRHILCVQQ